MERDDDPESPADGQREPERSHPDQDVPEANPAGQRDPKNAPSGGSQSDQMASGGPPPQQRGPNDSQSQQRGPGGPGSDRRSSTGQRGPNGPPTEQSPNGSNWKLYAFDLVSSAAIVVVIGGLLFTASGIWPPMVAVESGSMEPVLERGDLVYVMESDRFPGPGAHEETGIVTYRAGERTGYEQFDDYGDVIVFQPDGNSQQTPVIHRAMFWVDEGENWLNKANPRYYSGSVCEEVRHCPAPHSGFITKGDNNGGYDQVTNTAGRKGPVKPDWVVGTAEVAVPHLGNIRLGASGGSRADSPRNETAG